MRAIGYIRVSTEEQATTGHSIHVQRARLEAWCLARDMQLVDVITDAGVSASRLLRNRRGGAELLQRIHAGEADVAVVVSIDRMFRSAQDGLNTLLGTGKDDGLAVQSISEPCDTTTAMGRFILTIWLARAQLEREQTCERNAAVTRSLKAQGRAYGHTPFGCVSVGGRLYRCPVAWPIRERLVDSYKRKGARGIASELQRAGIAAPAGGTRWSPSTVIRIVASHGDLNHIPALPGTAEAAVSTEDTP